MLLGTGRQRRGWGQASFLHKPRTPAAPLPLVDEEVIVVGSTTAA